LAKYFAICARHFQNTLFISFERTVIEINVDYLTHQVN